MYTGYQIYQAERPKSAREQRGDRHGQRQAGPGGSAGFGRLLGQAGGVPGARPGGRRRDARPPAQKPAASAAQGRSPGVRGRRARLVMDVDNVHIRVCTLSHSYLGRFVGRGLILTRSVLLATRRPYTSVLRCCHDSLRGRGQPVSEPASDHGAPTDAGAAARRLFELRRRARRPTWPARRTRVRGGPATPWRCAFTGGGKLVVFGNRRGQHRRAARRGGVRSPGHRGASGRCPPSSLTTDVATVTGIAERAGGGGHLRPPDPVPGPNPPTSPWGCPPTATPPACWPGSRRPGSAALLTIALAGGDGGQIAASKGSRSPHHHAVGRPAGGQGAAGDRVPRCLWELVHVFFEQPGVLGPGVLT